MVRHSLAARSLRHRRFARRMLVGQPLLARATEGLRPGSAPAYITLDGYQLPLGRILRRLPRQESYAAPWADDTALGASPVNEMTGAAMIATPPDETMLRLLPPLSAPDDFEATADATILDASPMEPISQAPAAAIPASARPDGRRPRSRIVELPGVIVQPIEPEGDENDQGAEIGGRDADEAAPETQAANATDTPAIETSEQQAQLTPIQDEPPAPAPRRQRRKRAAQPPRASDALFPPTDSDRSPQTWLARLQLQQGQQPAPAQPAQPTVKPLAPTPDDKPPARGAVSRRRAGVRPAAIPASEQPTASPTRPSQPSEASDAVERPAPLPESSRTLLHEATGVDPASVRIYRGSEAARVTSAQNSDALTDGEAIALGAGHATETPETLGLLAHELTHVAQRRAPRFVPPATQPAPGRRQSHAASSQPQPQPATTPVAPADEEAQAALVETRVTHLARTRQTVSFTAPVVAPDQHEPAARPDPREQPTPPGARSIWGGLPAPWEPLPDWLTIPGAALESAPAAPPGSAPQQPGQRAAITQPPSAAGSAASVSGSVPSVQRAERGRALPTAESEATPAHEGRAPEPDLDALAQQVHAILKRRLAAERRRFG